MKTANILRCHYRFSCKNNVWGKTAEILFLWHITTQNWVALLIGLSRGLSNFSANQKHYSDLASSEAPSELNFCKCSLTLIFFMEKPVVASWNVGTCFIMLYMLGWLRIEPHWAGILGFLDQKALFFKSEWSYSSKVPFLFNKTFSIIRDTLIFVLLIIMVGACRKNLFLDWIFSCLYLPLSLSEAA